jgi:hypothetical protein
MEYTIESVSIDSLLLVSIRQALFERSGGEKQLRYVVRTMQQILARVR